MATSNDVQQAFQRWNVTGEGRPTLTAGNWHFVGTVLFYQNQPHKRFVKAANGEPICLHRTTAEYAQVVPQWRYAYQEKYLVDHKYVQHKVWYVPEIGVLSHYDGDMLTELQLHERMRQRFLMELAHMTEEQLAGVNTAELSQLASKIMAHASNAYARWNNYSLTFDLGWGEAPRLYHENLRIEIDRRLKKYNDPKSVEARRRASARKTAKQALGLA